MVKIDDKILVTVDLKTMQTSVVWLSKKFGPTFADVSSLFCVFAQYLTHSANCLLDDVMCITQPTILHNRHSSPHETQE